MKANEIYIATAPGAPHVDGHEYRLVREVEPLHHTADVKPWLSVDIATGEERHWTPDQFGTTLKPRAK